VNESRTNESCLRMLYACPILGIAHSKNATNPEQMWINDCMGIHGETCYLLLYDHVTERLDGACRQSKASPLAWLKKWLTKNVKDDVKDRHVFMDQGGESCRSKAIRDSAHQEFGATKTRFYGVSSSEAAWREGRQDHHLCDPRKP